MRRALQKGMPLETLLDTASHGALVVVLGVGAFAALMGAMLAGSALRARQDRRDAGQAGDKPQDSLIVTSVLSLLGILLGFTFSLAVDRYDARRLLVLEEANAIGTAYLRAQLLEEPYRSALGGQLVAYTDNRIALAEVGDIEVRRSLMAVNDELIAQIWTTTAAAFQSIRDLDFSSAFIDSMNHLIDLDASRKIARQARVPVAVFAVLFFFLITSAGVLGYVQAGPRGRWAATFELALLTLFLLLVIDIDRPARGAVREGQSAMEQLRTTMGNWESLPPADQPGR
jgi:hypothetical protein